MGPVKTILALAGATALMSTAASAADFPPAMPPMAPQIVQAPPPVETGGWYLRGDVGVGRQTFTKFDHFQTESAFVWPASWRIDMIDMNDTAFAGFGVGFAWNSWFRFDVTGEYRAKAKFKTLGSYTEFCPGGRCFDMYDGNHAAALFLANVYVDLGTWWCITPFIGAGVGSAYSFVSGMSDIGFVSNGTTGFGFSSTNEFSKWNMAWAIHAGLAYNVSNNFKVEFAYRYVDFGNIQTGIVDCNSVGCSNTGGPRAFYHLGNFSSSDFKIGMRWMMQPEVIAPQPVYAPPPPAYQPPPPLMRRG
jgi:opacity protein-like surface antigen